MTETIERSVFCSDFSGFPEWKVKGSTLVSKVHFAARRFGDEAGEEVESWLTRAVDGPVLAAAWHPFEIYDRLLHELADRFFGGDLERLREVGKHSAHHALTETYSIFAMQKDFSRFLDRIATLHSRFYNMGRLVVTERGEDFSRHELREQPAISEADTHLALGFYLGAAEVMELRHVEGSFRVLDQHTTAYHIGWA